MDTMLASNWPGNFWLHWLIFGVGAIIFVLTLVMGFIYVERRAMGFMQARLGPNRTGPFGLLQAVADVVKVLCKEDIVPRAADKIIHFLAPVIALFPIILIFAVVPIGNGAMLADLNIGVLFVFAISSISAVGTFMAGWASNNKFSIIAAVRDVAAIISYEIPVLVSILGVVLLTGSMSMNQIVAAQNIPFVFYQPLGFLLFFIGISAEINRAPFDLMEADSEIVAGFHTEYSGMKFAAFYLVEYAEALAMSAVIATLFFGGWRGPFLPEWMWFIGKVFMIFFLMVWVRTTLPRVRIDQMMGFAWKFLFPLAIINTIITAIEVVVWPSSLPLAMILINWVVAIVAVVGWSKFFRLSGGKVES